MLLLDTCTLIWLSGDPKQLSQLARQIIAENADALYVSSISAWEVAVKVSTGKLRLHMPVSEWYREVLAHCGVVEIPVRGSHAIASAVLPKHHGDPADRFIIATAITENLTLVSPDPLLRRYPDVKVTW